MSDQPQNWTPETVYNMIDESCEAAGGGSLQRIADAHNAALSAEREKFVALILSLSDLLWREYQRCRSAETILNRILCKKQQQQ